MAAQAKQQATLGGLWEQATKKYKADLKRFDEEYQRKHRHMWNVHRHKKPSEEIPTLYSAKDFAAELERKKTDFRDMRMKAHGVFKAMNNLATPVEIIGGQASAIGSMFMPATPMVFGAVMYLFNAGRDVHESYDVLEMLFKKCTEAITDISFMVNGVRYLKIELQNTVIETLIAILDVFRIAADFARTNRFEAYADALGHPNKGGPEKQSLERLKDLNKRQDTLVGISSLVAIDVIDQKHDKTDRKIDYVSSTQTEIINQVTQVQQMLKEKTEDKTGPKRTIDAKQRSEDKAHNQLKKLLSPEASVSENAKEFHTTTAPGTCEWIFKEPEFEKWKTQPDVPILWIYGDSGVGKSHLAAKIVEHAGPSHLLGAKETSRAAVAAYFLEYDDSETTNALGSNETSTNNTIIPQTNLIVQAAEVKQVPKNEGANGETDEQPVKADGKAETAIIFEGAPKDAVEGQHSTEDSDLKPENVRITQILRTMAWQVSEDDKKYEKFLADHIRATEENCSLRSAVIDVWNYLFSKHFPPPHDRFITFVIDGVDNLAEIDRRALYRLIKQVVQSFKESETGPIRFVCLSQRTLKDEIGKAFSSHFEMPSITITEEKNIKDIETYISWTVDQSTKLKRALKDKTFRQETVAKLAGCTEGVFEMGALLLKQLAQKDHVDLFSEVLENPPKNIHCILKEMLEHFGDTHTLHDITDLNSLLSWVLYAYEPLTLGQLNAAIGLESEHGEFLDIRDKIGREFSAYFSIVDFRTKDTSSRPVKPSVETETIPLLGTGVEIAAESAEAQDNDRLDDLPSVKVAHASIAKFFRNSETSNHACIGVSREEAHLRLAKTCLRAICYKPEENSKPWKSMTTTEKLFFYATTYFPKHLKEARSAATAADKVEIFRLLTKLFRDEHVISQWVREIGFWPDFFDLEKALGVVWSWFSNEDVLNALKDEEKQWVVEPCPSTAERILKPIALWYAKNWLQDPVPEHNNQSMYFFVFLRSLVNLFERSKEQTSNPTGENEEPTDIKNWTADGKDAPAIPPDTLKVPQETPDTSEDGPPQGDEPKEETPIYGGHPFHEAWELKAPGDEIRKIAEWAGFEKTPLWYCRVGNNVSALTKSVTEEVLVDFKTALKIDPDFGAAHFRIATIYGDVMEPPDYDRAITQMEEARRVKYGESVGSMRRAAIWIAKWQEAKADTPGASDEAKNAGRQQAMKTLETELQKSPEEFDLIAAYVEVAGKSGNHKAVMSRLLGLGAKLPDFLRSDEFEVINGLHQTIRRAAQKTRRVGALKRAYETAIEKDKEPQYSRPDGVYIHIDLLESLAKLFVENQEDDRGLAQYQTVIDYADEMGVSFYADAAANRVALLHLNAACSKGSSEKEKKDALEDLIKLEKEERDPDNNVISATYTSHGLTLGYYYKLVGELEQAHALFKDRVALAMSLLDDDDADNDWHAWEILATTLLKDGDLENGKAAAGMHYKELKKMMMDDDDEEKKNEEAAEDEQKSDEASGVPDAETNSQAAPAPTQSLDGPATNGCKDTAAADTEKTAGSVPAAKSGPEPETNYEDTPWQTGPCDGICDSDLRENDKGVYLCIHCTGTWFCVECWEKHRESSLPYLLCDSDHEFAYVTGPPKNLEKEKIKVGDKVRDLREWLDGIREKWGLPLEKVVEVKEEVKE